MKTYTPGERQFLLSLSKIIVTAVAADELSLFDDLAEEYFDDPSPPQLSGASSDDPLAAGLNDFLVPATPAAMAMVSTALDVIQRIGTSQGTAADSAPPPNVIQAVLQNQIQRTEIQLQVYRTAIRFHIPSDTAIRMAEALIDALDNLADSESCRRVINAWIDGQGNHQSLQVGQVYHLNFNVDCPREDSLGTASGVDELTRAMPPGQETIEVLVLIETEDFLVYEPDPQTLYVPGQGPSNIVQFTLSPQRAGHAAISAFFSIDQQIFQKMELTLQVGEPVAAMSNAQPIVLVRGEPIESAMRSRSARPGISLIIEKRDAGYKLILYSESGVRRAHINISESDIAALVAEARNTLRSIVRRRVGELLVYQSPDTTIPEAIHQQALQQLADLGMHLFHKLFYSGRGEDVAATGNLLRSLMRTHQFHVRIVAERFIFPWALLYDREDLTTIDPEGFWGFRHLISCMPEFSQPDLHQFSRLIRVSGELQLDFVYDNNLDRGRDGASQVLQNQRTFLHSLRGVAVSEHADRQALFALLNNPAVPPHIIYFYCHAVSYVPGDMSWSGEPHGVAHSYLTLTDGDVTLLELERRAPIKPPLFRRAPLVFINACESAELSPYLYDGLVPYMIAKGARGVLGTEVDTPIYFAAEFAQELLRRLTAGEASLGEIVLSLRRSYLYEKHNLLGLLYTLYINNDITVEWVGSTD